MHLVLSLLGGFTVKRHEYEPTDQLVTESMTTGSLTIGSLTIGSLTIGSLTTGSLTTGQSISFATDRARALLAYLAIEADRLHRREALATLLWPDDREASARQNLSQTLTRVRQAIGDYDATPPFLQITRPTLQLNRTAPITIDLLDFQHLLAVCANHEHSDLAQCDTCVERLVSAIELYGGPFLEGTQLADSAPFEEWVLLVRQQAQNQLLGALDTVTIYYAAKGDHRLAQQYAARQLVIEPWRESAHRQLMGALVEAGQRGAALAQFESCRRLLGDELGVEPEAATIDLVEKIRDGELAPSSPHPSPTVFMEDTSSPAQPIISSHYLTRARLEPRHDQQLFGVATSRARVHALLQAEARPWIIALDGIGGIGKTTLATDLAHEFVESGRFADIGWVSAKQEEFQPGVGIQSTDRPALDTPALTDALLTQLTDQPPLSASPQEKERVLLHLLKERSYLVVIDNLESALDLDVLTPYLRELANPTKFLLTTRFSLRIQAEVYSHTLSELSEADTLALIRHESNMRGMTELHEATPAELTAIYQVVGGNPLALKLVMGQVGFLPLPQVLANLTEARGKPVDELYTYIYWQAWQLLNPDERQLFLSTPLAPNATFDQLALVSALDEEILQAALTRLIEQSLIQVAGDLSERRYRLHRLTETFLMNEVLKWRSMA